MPRKRVPQDELFGPEPQSQQRPPDDRRGRFGETVSTDLPRAGPPRCDIRKTTARIDTGQLFSSEQELFRRHWNAREMPAAISEGFSNHCDSGRAQPADQIQAQLLPPNTRGRRADVIFFINLPPWIENRTR